MGSQCGGRVPRHKASGVVTNMTAQAHQLPIPNYQFPITNSQFPITNYQLPITNYQLPMPNLKFVSSG
ncbi:MAG: hypothetical protein KME31_19950 [Tolypothrix carrinoi HA7290-LM1]|nr:hypothetical protein [Tolypothrix carrinoi HA7290-LM1]